MFNNLPLKYGSVFYSYYSKFYCSSIAIRKPPYFVKAIKRNHSRVNCSNLTFFIYQNYLSLKSRLTLRFGETEGAFGRKQNETLTIH